MVEEIWKGSGELFNLRDVALADGTVALWKSGIGADATWGGEMRVTAELEPSMYSLHLVPDGKRKVATGRVRVTVQRRTGHHTRLLLTGIGLPPF